MRFVRPSAAVKLALLAVAAVATVCGQTSNLKPSETASREAALPRAAASPSYFPTVSAAPGSEEFRAFARSFVDGRLALWQHRLKLDDWKITLVMSRRGDMKPQTLGGTHWDKKKKIATVWVMDPSDYTIPATEILSDLELTTVHELVHLELATLPRSEASRSEEEHAVNRISEALLAMERAK